MMRMDVVVEAELPACLDVIHAGFATAAREFGLTAENCPTNGAFMPLARLQRDFARGDHMFVCVEDGRKVGFAQGTVRDADTVELEKLAVLPAYRGRGYGSALVERVKAFAAEAGARRVCIGIIAENTRLKAWYEKNGFTSTGTRRFAHLPFTVAFMECVCAAQDTER